MASSLCVSVARQMGLKRATPAFSRLPFAVPLSGFDQQRVELIIKPVIGWEMMM